MQAPTIPSDTVVKEQQQPTAHTQSNPNPTDSASLTNQQENLHQAKARYQPAISIQHPLLMKLLEPFVITNHPENPGFVSLEVSLTKILDTLHSAAAMYPDEFETTYQEMAQIFLDVYTEWLEGSRQSTEFVMMPPDSEQQDSKIILLSVHPDNLPE